MTEAMVVVLEMLIAAPKPMTAFAIARQSLLSLGRVQSALDEGIAYDLVVRQNEAGIVRYRVR